MPLKKKTGVKTLTKVSEIESKRQAQAMTTIISISVKMLAQLESKVDEMDEVDEKKFRAIAATVKDIKDVLDIKTPEDLEEQKTRIEKLRAEIKKDDAEAKAVSVVFKGADEEWLN